MVLGRNANDEAGMSEDELMEAQIIDCLYKAFTQDSSHHLLFNEDLIQIALFCLEYCRDISIDVKRKLARLISISSLIQERLMKKEIIMGISHLLEHKDEKEMVKHTVIALSHMSMNHKFSSSPLSVEIIKKLIDLIPIFDGKELYILLLTISKIMDGRDENKGLFFNNEPNYLASLIQKVYDNNEQKDLVLAVSLIIKELFNHPEILNKLRNDSSSKIMLEEFIVFLYSTSKFTFESSFLNAQNMHMKRAQSHTLNEYQGRSEILGFEFDLINKIYEPLDMETLPAKLDANRIESKEISLNFYF